LSIPGFGDEVCSVLGILLKETGLTLAAACDNVHP